jgi:glycosyltransferase involved in cell wall biosynthesis
MRVLHVISTLNIGSGIANAILNYYRKIDRNNLQFDFLVFSEPEKTFTKEVFDMGGRVFEIAAPTLKTSLQYSNKIKKFFQEHTNEWAWVHIHEILVQKYIIKAARRVGNIKIAMHSHASQFVLPNSNVGFVQNKINMLIKRIRNAYLLSGFKNKTDLFLACSYEAGVALYGKTGARDKRFHILNNSIDVEKYCINKEIRRKLRKEWNIENKKVLINVGRLCEEKNQRFLIDIFSLICKTEKDYCLILVGAGRMENVIRQKVREYGLMDKVLFLGNRTDIANVLMAADVFVFPSIVEGLGIALVEAQASGLHCISSSTIPSCAIVTPYVKVVDLHAGVEIWAREILSSSLIRNNGNEIVANSAFNIEKNIDVLMNLYNGEKTE